MSGYVWVADKYVNAVRRKTRKAHEKEKAGFWATRLPDSVGEAFEAEDEAWQRVLAYARDRIRDRQKKLETAKKQLLAAELQLQRLITKLAENKGAK